jgi:hypothetical protein
VPTAAKGPGNARNAQPAERVEHDILFQTYFKSVGPRTYAAQVKRATNGNHYLVLTEGRRDKESGEVRKLRVNVFSEDFDAFFDLLRQTAAFIKANPLPPEVVEQRKRFWKNAAKASARCRGGNRRRDSASRR